MLESDLARCPEVEIKVIRVHRVSLSLTILIIMCLTGVAHSQDHSLSIQGGFFRPWDQGENGNAASIRYLRRTSEHGHFGAEVGYRHLKGKIFNTEVPVRAIRLDTVYRYDILADSLITPYAGVGFGLAIGIFSGSKVEKQLKARYPLANIPDPNNPTGPGLPQTNTFESPSVSAGLDMFAMLGVDFRMPFAEWVSLFAETRYSYTPLFSKVQTSLAGDDDNQVDVDNIGGLGANIGVRFSF